MLQKAKCELTLVAEDEVCAYVRVCNIPKYQFTDKKKTEIHASLRINAFHYLT